MNNNENQKKGGTPTLATRLITRHQKVSDNLRWFCKMKDQFTLYAYTQTFAPSSFDGAPISKQIHCKMCDIFIQLATCCDFIILPEVHKSGKKYGAVHFHGVLHIKKEWKWFNKCLPYLKSLGFVTIKPIFELTKWLDYLVKDYATFIKCSIDDYSITNCAMGCMGEVTKVKEYIKNI